MRVKNLGAPPTKEGRQMQFDVRKPYFDGRIGLAIEMRRLFAHRSRSVSLRAAQQWFRGTNPSFVEEVYLYVKNEGD